MKGSREYLDRIDRVIPAQAGIQTLVFQEYLKIAAIPTLWIPACAGMTVWGVLI